MKISWFGHSCFCIQSSTGISILTDPFDESIGYKLPEAEAEIVLISHNHYDHNNVNAVKGKPAVIKGPGTHTSLGLEFKGLETYHDEKGGRLRGANTIFCFELDGIKTCHLGDLGHILKERDIKAIGSVDVLFLPVGGIFTIDAEGANKVIQQLKPRIAIPMHYRTEALRFELDPVDRFLKGHKFEGPMKNIEVVREDLPLEGTRIFLFSYI